MILFGYNTIFDMPYDFAGLLSMKRCPQELKELNLEGIYFLLRQPTPDEFYFHWDVQKCCSFSRRSGIDMC